MKNIFKTISGQKVDLVPYTFEVIRNKPMTKIFVGADSQKKRNCIKFAVVVAYRYGELITVVENDNTRAIGKGCHFISKVWEIPRKGAGSGDALIEKRLLEEINSSIMTAEVLRSNSIHVEQIDLDLNGDPKWKSNKFVQMGVGWAKGMGYKVSIKPDFQVAAKAANHVVNK
jgi:predicted RNase H-related nuclease YkuK (DUF458 family)